MIDLNSIFFENIEELREYLDKVDAYIAELKSKYGI